MEHGRVSMEGILIELEREREREREREINPLQTISLCFQLFIVNYFHF